VTCHDLGLGHEDGHPRLWPLLVARLAPAWGLRPDELRRRLAGRYVGSHGGDAPVRGGLRLVRRRFGLGGAGLKVLESLDDYERMLPGDRAAVRLALGAAADFACGRDPGDQDASPDSSGER
jgi:hypothetical protein